MNSRAALQYLKLLCNLRWLAVVGQAATVALVVGPMHVTLLEGPLWAGIAVLVAFNVYASWRIRHASETSDAEVFAHMLIDILVLAWLVGFSGGIENPFASLFLIPIALSILILPPGLMTGTATFSAAAYFGATFLGVELPPSTGMFGLHKLGMLANFVVSATVILIFFTRMTAAKRKQEHEVAHLREQFARNEGILALATHAASVAHELNTPLGTLTLIIEELVAEASTDAQREQYAMLQSLIAICRDRVRELAAPADSDANGESARADLDDVIEHWQLVRPTISLSRTGSIAGFAKVDPSIGHLLQALLNNAADASERSGVARVDLNLRSDATGLYGTIRDYGVGFDQAQPPLPAVLFRSSKPRGLGIGLALSHATVERLGGQLSMQATEGRGVRVEFSLPATTS